MSIVKNVGVRQNERALRGSFPGLLVSFVFLQSFLENQHRFSYRDWALDSGAFSVHNSGKKIDLSQYIDTSLKLLQGDSTLTEIFALDVIGEGHTGAEKGLKNCEEMWRQGVPAIPCFHKGDPEEFLLHIARQYPKIALGGVANAPGDFKLAWLEQCFARIWPKKIHGFAMSGENIIFNLPFHSVDATNWEMAPCAFGQWKKFGTMCVRGSNQDLRSQVQYYLKLEAKARVRWAREMGQLDELPDCSPSIRLAAVSTTGPGGRSTALLNPQLHLSAIDKGSIEKRSIFIPAPKISRGPPPERVVGGIEKKWADYWGNQGFCRPKDKPKSTT